ncbi:polysaccharide biosynthesis protein [Brumimicrobium aurantiacum]|uniref:Polysaccharide biosynthesis protein n=1 Tax=Brumimicrobium aurantiacum TaxID=1737063 RepID=A0A3E1EZZ2_9FLAO|nr:nucleoside-diphosphate sugar epimerase/dehydratase [Brumimicrobium aurantiacum]RFC55126.1 polysaccharide biosynthesis protein [Brumimicrobium aurantiacum]
MKDKQQNSSLLDINNTPRSIVMLMDFIVFIAALTLAYLIRFDFYTDSETITKEWGYIKDVLPFVILLKPVVFFLFKIHKGLVRFTSLADVKRIFFALLTYSSIIFVAGLVRYIFVDNRFILPNSIIIVEFLVSLLFMIGFRFTVKVIYFEMNKPKDAKRKNILIFGAGVSGLITKRTIEKDPNFNSKIVAFLDDNKNLESKRLEGTSIYKTDNLERLIDKYDVTELIVAIQEPNKAVISSIVEICLEKEVEVKRVPSFKKWINGEFSINQIRKINIDDLLGREPINLNVEGVKNQIKDKVILITGAAGSIGSGITKQVVHYSPKKLILLDQWESGLYDLHIDLIAAGLADNVEIVIGSVRDKDRMENLFDQFKPSIVFHAAAYKHVPLMEGNPSESVLTNVLGTKVIVDLSDHYKAEKMVMISTDKAVNPTNVMGASKRIAEIYAQKINETSQTQFVTTRFGNVLGSNGSVIPLFKKQIDQGGPITVTDVNVTRYFMTIPEACQLVLEASAMGNGGEIFVFDMGEPVKIVDLAKKMIRLSGLEYGKDIDIKISGLRPGEKLYEELLANEENTLPTHHKQILRAQNCPAPANIISEIEALIGLFKKQNNEEIVIKMKQIVPEFLSNNSEFTKLDK